MATLIRIVLIAACVVSIAAERPDDPRLFSRWSEPVNLGPLINTAGNDSGPRISCSGLALYFSSDHHGGYGRLDIFVSQRANVDEPWGPPQNLGPNVNTSAADNAAYLSPDGHRL